MRLTIQSAIKGILILQMGIALLLMLGEFSPGTPNLYAPRAPELSRPARPGDQTRRYTRQVPDTPSRPYEMPAGLPSRLALEPVPGEPNARALIGSISPGDAERMIEALSAHTSAGHSVRKLYLNSPGGSVVDALALGRHLRADKMETVVTEGDICLSACPYIFAGGTKRSAKGALGVHQHSFGENSYLPAFLAVEDIQRGQSEVMAYLDEMGLDVRLMRPALATGPNDIYIFVEDELTEYKLTTAARGGT